MPDPAEERWDEMTIPRALLRAAERWPAERAIDDEARSLTFHELASEAAAAARAFLAGGVAHGDRVGIWAPNVLEWVVAALGAQSVGATIVTLNTRFKAGEAAYALKKAGVRVLCTMGDFLGTNYADSLTGEDLPELSEIVVFRGSSSRGRPWQDFLASGSAVSEDDARARLEAVKPDDLSDFLWTSGTTGQPKAVMTTHGQSLKVFDVWSRGVGLREGDRMLIIPPFFHSFGYKAGWLACLIRGATALPHQVFDVAAVLERVARERITAIPGPPTIFQSLLAFPGLADHDISSLRLAVTGAATIPVELIQRMRDTLGFDEVITAYGLTESSGTVSMCLPTDDAETIATTAGRAIPDTEVRCVGPDGQEMPRGEPGEVVVRGYNVMRGYFDDPAETARTIDADGWLHTGDIGVMDERGYLRITDRIKDMFIMGGFNVYPAEVENLMFGHEGIAAVAVIGVPDERMGEVGMAFVVPAPGAELDANAVVAWCREHMANYKVPRRVTLVEELPTNASGKVLKTVLRKWAAELDTAS